MSKQLEKGDKFVMHNCKVNRDYVPVIGDCTIGKVYKIIDDGDGLGWKDDSGDFRDLGCWTGDFKFTKIVK